MVVRIIGGILRILIIDDDKSSTDLMRVLLSTYPAEVHITNNPSEGIELARQIRPGLILLDQCMPEMDGKQVCQVIRKTSSTPILILSAADTPDMIASILDAGADDFLEKPVSREMLFAYINKLTRYHKTGPLLSIPSVV